MRILIFLLVSFFFLGQLAAQDESDSNTQNDPRCETRRVINETTGAVHVITTCVDNAPNEEKADTANQKITNDIGKPFNRFVDLDAQVSMAHSTYWLKWLTAVGVVIGGIGLYLLGKTLKETRSASFYARETLDVARDEFRCSIVIGSVRAESYNKEWPGEFKGEIPVLNKGKTDALDCRFQWGEIDSATNPPTIHSLSEPEQVGTGKVYPQAANQIKVNFIVQSADGPMPPERFLRVVYFDKYNKPICDDCGVKFRISKIPGRSDPSPQGYLILSDIRVLFDAVYVGCLDPEGVIKAARTKKRQRI